jgi:hypothetical protein
MAPFIGILATAFAVIDNNGKSNNHSTFLALTGADVEPPSVTDPPVECDLPRLCELFGASPVDTLSLRTNSRGIRGVYLNSAVQENDVILRIPLDSCLRDDAPPDWLEQPPAGDEDDAYAVSVEGWVTRLTACLLDAQLKEEKSEALQTWLELLPTNLRQLLPIHWDSTTLLASAKCRPLELAVDSAYFARSGPIGDLMASVSAANMKLSQRQVEDALDLVQTRSCRAEASDGTPYMRVLVPIFDMINHNRDHNAEFFREGDFMVVRAKRAIEADSEVFINYGGSTSPAWRCLFSYGFVPLSEDIYEDDEAEIILDGMRIEVGPTEIPFQLVQFEAEKLGMYKEGEELEFTAEIGQKIVDRIVGAAKDLDKNTLTGPGDDDSAATRSIADLRESNRRTLLACVGGLREFLENM